MTILALELGTNRIAVGRIDDDEGAQEMKDIPLPTHSAWQSCRDLLREVAGEGSVRAVGIASSGPIDMVAGVVATTVIPEWRTGFDIVTAVRELFPGARVTLALDGVCHALAERQFGGTRGVLDSLVVTVAARISGGVTVGGLAVVGRTGNAGHIGHVLVPGFDDVCECGGHGCLEAVAGGASAVRWARARGWAGNSERELIEAAAAGDAIAAAVLERAGTALGRAIASVAALLDIDLVVVGGTFAEAGPAMWTPLGKAVSDHARLGFLPGLRVVRSALGEDAVLVGAGLLALATEP